MLIKSADGELGPSGDVLDGGFLVAFFTKQRERGGFQPIPFLVASLLDGRRGQILAREKLRALRHGLVEGRQRRPIRRRSTTASSRRTHPPFRARYSERPSGRRRSRTDPA